MALVFAACFLTTLVTAAAQGCSERGAPDHGRMRVILQRTAGVMVAYWCDQGYRREGPVYSVCLKGVWTTPLPNCIASSAHSGKVADGEPSDQGVLVSHEELPLTQRSIAVRKVKQIRKKRKRKRKDKRMDPSAMAGSDSYHESSLDTSCMLSSTEGIPKFIRPPKVPNSLGPKFVRRKSGSQKYFVAIYRCQAGYKLHNPHSRSLGCQSSKWVGTLPICLPRRKKHGCINAGCDHGCKEINDKPKCFCFKGFRQNGKHCFDENECLVNNGGCQRSCHNTPGSFYCGCPPGYRLASDSTSCVDINECLSRNGHGPCQGQCHNVDGSFFCSCEGFPGSQLAEDGVTCADIDECNDPDHRLGCSHACVNTRGSAFCLCPLGYELDADWTTCQDINECERRITTCKHGCVNTIGSFICKHQTDCEVGYMRFNGTCQDMDECAVEASLCSHSCSNTQGSFSCSCPVGFMLANDGRTCIDIDECSEFAEGHLCSHMCQNTQGSYRCLCPSDYELASDYRTCHPKEDECQRKNCSHDCVIEDDHAVCVCDEGYTLEDDVTCVDIDECEENEAKCSHNCVNEEGTYYCTCPKGHSLLADKKTCNKKQCDLNICPHGCINETEILTCACPRGFEKIYGSCRDVNECELTLNLCPQLCKNTEGSYECHCKDGFYLDAHGSCIDVDECQEKNICSTNKTCVNTDGSYLCSCRPGFKEISDTGHCEDIDECSFTVDEDSSLCSHLCINSLGSFHCECPLGYFMGKDSRTCEDIDECSENNEIDTTCSHKCVNTVGSYNCECPDSYILEDNHICVATSGCDVNNGGCSHTCIENDGFPFCECPEEFILANDSVTCIPYNTCTDNSCFDLDDKHFHTCLEGYEYQEDMEDCVDINECLNNNGNCPQKCENTDGSFLCECFTGFEKHIDTKKCVDVNECAKNMSVCDQICLNTEGSYKCECNTGYILLENSTECRDINECVNSTVCEQICHNLVGSYKCDCYPGFTLSSDSVSCEDINECSVNMSNCSQICKNIDGGFLCDCEHGFKLVNGSVCVEENNATQEVADCDHSNAIMGEEKSCCCKTGYILVNKTKCVHASVCHQTVGCNVSKTESNICQSSDVTSQMQTLDTHRQGCPPPDSPVKLDCNEVDLTLGNLSFPAATECRVSCRPGFKLDGSHIITCLNGSWSGFFQCIAHVRPFIRCPPAIRLNLPAGRNSTNVTIPQPKTNMNWEKHITTKPSWGKQLQTVLPFGTTSVQFSAVSPSSNYVAKCSVTIQVKDVERPTIEDCPGDMKITLQPGNSSTEVSWPEPTITDNVKIAHLYQSQRPGVALPRGVYKVNYIAADTSGNIAMCQFTISVVALED